MVYCFFPSTPPAQAKSKGPKGVQQGILLTYQDAPHQFAAGLKDVACLEPGCCIASACCAPCGITACYSRKPVLEKYHNGMDDFVCCQNYIPKCCCIEPASMCRGSPVGLCLEGFCCPMFSLSIARMHLMDSKQIRPDPCDWQIIQCSNCLQLLSCIIDIAAAFAPELRDLALIIDLIADLFTFSVAGCMGAQVYHEIKNDKDGIQHIPVVQGIALPVAQGGAVPMATPVTTAQAIPMAQPVVYNVTALSRSASLFHDHPPPFLSSSAGARHRATRRYSLTSTPRHRLSRAQRGAPPKSEEMER